MRTKARTDGNHQAIVETLRKCGWYVEDMSRAGNGFPDLVAFKSGRVEFVEVKDGALPPSRQRLTPAERTLHSRFFAAGVRVRIVTTPEEAARL